MPLASVEEGKRVYIMGVNAGQGLKSRLASMGLVPGTAIDVIMNSPHGPFIIAVRGSRIVLGHGMARKIMVA